MTHFRTGHSDSCMCSRCGEMQPTAAEIDDLRAKLAAAQLASDTRIAELTAQLAQRDKQIEELEKKLERYGEETRRIGEIREED